jgi:hypothetical protein
VHKRRENKPLKLREEGIEKVDEFIYLSRVIAKKNGTTKDAGKEKTKQEAHFKDETRYVAQIFYRLKEIENVQPNG